MKYTSILPFLIVFSLPVWSLAQEDVKKIQQEIDRQLWKPFAETYGNQDAEGFNALHTDDVIRSGPSTLLIGEEYKERNREGFKKGKEMGIKRTISFTLESRQTRPELSYEVGYYKVTVVREGKEDHFYGRFHCVLKKIDGQWKVAQDWDTDKVLGNKIDEEDYQTGTPVKW